nr:MAG TPA: baseplate protein [Caudoviricetes sp.]
MSRETSNLGLILYDPSEDKDVKVRDLINKVLGFTDSNTIKIDAKTKDIDTKIKTLHDSIIGTDGNVVFYNKQEVFLAVYPVGSIFLSTDGTEPAELYGGTWEQIKDVFLLGASDTYPAGSTGGSTAHEHEYKLGFMWRFGALVGYPTSAIDTYNYKTQSWNNNNKKVNDGQYTLANDGFSSTYGEKSGGQTYSVTGNTASSSSIPPYYSVYIWRRVA